MAAVDIDGVRKSFGATPVIHGVDLEIADREFVVLVGPSGCGKSTLLRMIAGLESISAGTVRIGGVVVNDVPPQRRNIAMVFQSYALYPHMTAFDNVAFGLRQRRTPAAAIDERVQGTSRMLGVLDYLERRPKQLSGGQRQRVAMGRAIVREPDVFLFDEPLSNLDAQLRVQVRTEIKDLHYRLQTTTVYVTHDQIEAMTLADRIVVLRDGRVEQIGTPMELYDAPVNTFVASFIGSPAINMLPATLRGGAALLEDGSRLPLTSGGEDGRPVLLGVRPEDLALAEAGRGIPARVVVSEPTGPEVQVFADAAGGRVCAALRVRERFAPGTELSLAPDPARIHLFDRETGRRLPA